MKSPEIKMYNALRPSLGEEDAQVFIEANNESIAAKIEIMKSDLATKGDIGVLKDQVAGLEIKMTGQMAALDSKITGQMSELDTRITGQMSMMESKISSQMSDLRADIKGEMSKHRVESARTSYIVGFIQLLGIIGALLAIIKASR